MRLLEAQQKFARLLPRLIDHAYLLGFSVTMGEAYRPQETAELYALQGMGVKNSLHPLRLAVDLHLFQGEKYLTRSEDHEPLGRFWERLDPSCVWGGRFARPDGNHYSLSWGGRA